MNEPANFRTNEESESGDEKLESLKCPLNGTDSEFDKPPFETTSVYFYKSGVSGGFHGRSHEKLLGQL